MSKDYINTEGHSGEERESGFLGNPKGEFEIKTGFTDVEIIRVSEINVIAKGRRFGRYWLLKGLIKEKRRSPSAQRRLQKEFDLQSRLLNPGIAQAIAFEEVDDLGLCIVSEWIEGESLAEILKKGEISKQERRRIMKELLSTVSYINSCGVVHRDLKPSNIMIRKAGGGVVLVDFGLADTDDYAELKQSAGTPGYVSPEQEKEGGAKVTDDIYSLGVIIRDLCPDYSSIASKCTGPAVKRPQDAEKVKKLIEHKERRPKQMLWTLGAAIIAGIIIFAALHIDNLRNSTLDAQDKVKTLTERNHENERRMAELSDSLAGMTSRLKRAQADVARLDKYDNAFKNAQNVLCKEIDDELRDFNNRVMPMFNVPEQAFYDSINNLHSRLEKICLSAQNTKKFPDLRKEDAVALNDNITQHYLTQYAKKYNIWLAKIYGFKIEDKGNLEAKSRQYMRDSIFDAASEKRYKEDYEKLKREAELEEKRNKLKD